MPHPSLEYNPGPHTQITACSAFKLKSKDMGHFTPCEWPALINLVMLESLLAFVGVSATRWWLLLSGPLTGSSLCKMTELGKDDK